MTETFHFELVSPEKKLVSEQAFEVVAPGTEGVFGVRAGHMPVLATLKGGVVEVIREKGAKPERFEIQDGFADVTATTMTIIAERATPLNEAA
jgi:F-type H+-transporting ATPase subunit epsilon